MHIQLKFKHLTIRKGYFWSSSLNLIRAVARPRNALTITIFSLFAMLVMAPVLAGCSKGDEPVRTDPTTRALTHADSVRLGLIIELQADSAWDGTIDVKF